VKRIVLIGLFVLMVAGAVFAQRPSRNVNRHRHPNIAAAQRLTAQAYKKIVDAQQANEYDLGGHAKKAKDLLEQANAELKLAAGAANKN
jgi:hypothetical protein